MERIWPSEPPAGIPFAQSVRLKAIGFTGRHAEYGDADTWFPSWAENGKLYSPWTDGTMDKLFASSGAPDSTTGYATVSGNDPLHLTIDSVGSVQAVKAPYGGRYPAGSLVYRGVWYYGTYCLRQTPGLGLNWDILGPFVGFRYSTDYGRSWHETTHTPSHPLFPEPEHTNGKVKLGNLHFVDFGQNLQYSPDGKAYLISHGAADPDPLPRPANLSWITGDQIYLARVTPGIDTINDARAYEYFAGNDAQGKPRWSREFSRLRPLLEWNNHMGCVTVTYDAPLHTFLMCVTDGKNTIAPFDTYILESPAITGPWKLVSYLKDFGPQAYFVNFPSKFISLDGKTAWLSYSANFTNGDPAKYHTHPYAAAPVGSRYGWCLQEVRLLGP